MIQTRSLASPYATAVSNGRQELVADAPTAKGGGGAGFGAHELLEAALAVCLNMAVRMHAESNGLPLTGVNTRVSLHRPAPDTVCFEYSLELTGPLTDDHRGQLEEIARTCPVRQTLSKRIDFASSAARLAT